MFTGLIEDVGSIAAVAVIASGEAGARRLTVATSLAEHLPIGASIAVDGTCLTVVEVAPGRFSAIAGAETLACTSLGGLAAGDRVNLERPLRMGDRLGGHLVAGHVDGVGRVSARTDRGEALDVTIETPPALLRYVIAKGSIALDGISLTVNVVDARGFTVSLIPHTQTATTLAAKAVGAAVNLEVDLIGKYVEKLVSPLAAQSAPVPRVGLTLDKLKEHGFAD
ncbi:MAG: riboflavin synthase [Myxococcales bacterium]|nr:riboflavin synthase [Myxococcales bacterium]